MIDLLILNPGVQAGPLVRALDAANVSYQIVTTPGQMFAYPPELSILDLNANPWDRSQIYKSALSWTNGGQRWLDSINDQIVLHNKPRADRSEYYLSSKFEFELGRMFNILSYKGQHVVIDAFVYKNAKWNSIKDQTLPFFINGVESAFTFLDSVGVQNGPCQVFIEPAGKLSIRMVPKAIGLVNTSTRSFLDIWPTILSLVEAKPAAARLAFFSWIVRTGPAKQFQLETGL
jgi:hypothetical protein